MIEEYHFGSITISGKIYNYDVELRWTGEVLKWQREEGHSIGEEDVNGAIAGNPDLIVIGTGESGLAEVSEGVKEKILSEGIGLMIEKIGKAITIFNNEQKRGRKVIGLFHLTC
jgi:hypothetical protein